MASYDDLFTELELLNALANLLRDYNALLDATNDRAPNSYVKARSILVRAALFDGCDVADYETNP